MSMNRYIIHDSADLPNSGVWQRICLVGGILSSPPLPIRLLWQVGRATHLPISWHCHVRQPSFKWKNWECTPRAFLTLFFLRLNSSWAAKEDACWKGFAFSFWQGMGCSWKFLMQLIPTGFVVDQLQTSLLVGNGCIQELQCNEQLHATKTKGQCKKPVPTLILNHLDWRYALS